MSPALAAASRAFLRARLATFLARFNDMRAARNSALARSFRFRADLAISSASEALDDSFRVPEGRRSAFVFIVYCRVGSVPMPVSFGTGSGSAKNR